MVCNSLDTMMPPWVHYFAAISRYLPAVACNLCIFKNENVAYYLGDFAAK